MPRKNVAYRIAFAGRKLDGLMISSGTGMDSEVSKDQGTFTDCTNEATEIATTSGIYYLDLTSTEMNADQVIVKCTWTNAGALPFVIILYPQEAGDIQVNSTYWNGGAIPATNQTGVPITDLSYWKGIAAAAVDAAGYPKVTHKVGTGTGEINLSSGAVPIQAGTGTGQLDFNSGVVKANVTQWIGQTVQAFVNGIPKVDIGYLFGTILAEAAGGRLAASFNKWFGPATPTGTVNSLPDAVPNNAAGLPLVNVLATTTDMNDALMATVPNVAADSLTVAGKLVEVSAVKVKTDQMAFGTANRVNAQVYGMEGGTVTANAIGSNAIGASELAADAATEIAAAVWNALRSGFTTPGTMGEGPSAIVNGIATGTPTATTMAASALASTQNDQYNTRLLLFTSGALIGVATTITDYVNTGRVFTFDAVPVAPSAGDTFIIV